MNREINCHLKPIRGYYTPNIQKPEAKMVFKNKGYRNLAYLLQAFLSASDQTIWNRGGITYLVNSLWTATAEGTSLIMTYSPVNLTLGESDSAHDVTRYELFDPITYFVGADGHWFKEELASLTRLRTYHRYAIPDTHTCREAGLYLWLSGGTPYVYEFLLTRAIIDPPIVRLPFTVYEDGYRLDFPASYTRWFTEVLLGRFNVGIRGSLFYGNLITDTDSVTRVCRRFESGGSSDPDVRIGSDNTPPDPTHYNLLATIAPLGAQETFVEIDTVLQECRLIRRGTYTPPAETTLGEIGQFIRVYDTGGALREIMVARGIWEPPITLTPPTTYTISIILRLG